MISAHLTTFLNKPVKDFATGTPIEPEKYVYRLKLDYDDKLTFSDLLEAFVRDPKSAEVKELIIGTWSGEPTEGGFEAADKLVSFKDHFKELKALFFGEITYEEAEISWIAQTDMGPIIKAFPQLEHLQVRGSDGLALSELQHDHLKTLIVESGGLNPLVIEQVNKATLPNLEKLELWLGSDDYGFKSKVEDFNPILSGNQFPKLKWLGLMDSIIQDEIAIAVANAPVVKQIEELDLSMGILTDTGGAAFLNNDNILHLKHLNLRRHFMSEEMMEKLKQLPIAVNVADKEEDDDPEYRYVEVAE